MVQPTNLRSPTSQQSGTPQGGAQMGIQGTGNVNDLPLTMTIIGAIHFPQTIIQPNPQGTKESRFINVLMSGRDGKLEARLATRGDLLCQADQGASPAKEPLKRETETTPAASKILTKETVITTITSGDCSEVTEQITITDKTTGETSVTTSMTGSDKTKIQPQPSGSTAAPIRFEATKQGIAELAEASAAALEEGPSGTQVPNNAYVKLMSKMMDLGKLASTKDFNTRDGRVDPEKTIFVNMKNLIKVFKEKVTPPPATLNDFELSFTQWCICQENVIGKMVSDGELSKNAIAHYVKRLTSLMEKDETRSDRAESPALVGRLNLPAAFTQKTHP